MTSSEIFSIMNFSAWNGLYNYDNICGALAVRAAAGSSYGGLGSIEVYEDCHRY
jgi:hypothetical protein